MAGFRERIKLTDPHTKFSNIDLFPPIIKFFMTDVGIS